MLKSVLFGIKILTSSRALYQVAEKGQQATLILPRYSCIQA